MHTKYIYTLPCLIHYSFPLKNINQSKHHESNHIYSLLTESLRVLARWVTKQRRGPWQNPDAVKFHPHPAWRTIYPAGWLHKSPGPQPAPTPSHGRTAKYLRYTETAATAHTQCERRPTHCSDYCGFIRVSICLGNCSLVGCMIILILVNRIQYLWHTMCTWPLIKFSENLP